MIEHKSVSIAEQVFEKLEHDILSGVYEKGNVLTELKLSETLGVSRTPVREALRRLEQEHIIEMTSKGAMVIGISKEDIEMIYEMRMRIESLAVRRAAYLATDEEIQKLSEIVELQEFYTAKGNAVNIKNEDSRFHKELYKMCKSTPLADTLTELHKKVLKYRRASLSDSSRADKALIEHKSILEAIKAHDCDRAEALIKEHIKNARDSIVNREDN